MLSKNYISLSKETSFIFDENKSPEEITIDLFPVNEDSSSNLPQLLPHVFSFKNKGGENRERLTGRQVQFGNMVIWSEIRFFNLRI